MEEKIKELELRIEKLEFIINSGENISSKNKKLSAKEFLNTLSTKSEAQILLALCYFLENYNDFASINVNDIDTIFRMAKIRPPKNINDVVNKNISRGHLMDSSDKKDGKKAWCLTQSGEKYVTGELLLAK